MACPCHSDSILQPVWLCLTRLGIFLAWKCWSANESVHARKLIDEVETRHNLGISMGFSPVGYWESERCYGSQMLPRICFTFKGLLTMSCFECPSSWFQERTDRLYSGFQAGNQVTGINKITYKKCNAGVEAQTFTKQTMRSSTQLKETYLFI